MAKVTGPLLSMGASGTIGKTATFGTWKGIQYARQRVVPANPQTVAQQANRTTFALLREMFKLAPTILREPWDAFAQGRPFTGMNKFVGENLRVLGGMANMANFIGSPGAKGGLPPVSMTLSVAGGADQIAATFVPPSAPVGWTLTAAQAAAFPDQDPSGIFQGPLVAAQDLNTPYEVVLTGLTASGVYRVVGWLKWTKPDGSFAYSVSVSDDATPS